VIKSANRNHEAAIPIGTEYIRFGLRIYAGGYSEIKSIVLGHRPTAPADVIGSGKHLVLTNHYPSYEDLYRNGFVHSRIVAYQKLGINVDVFRLRPEQQEISFHEFQNIDVLTGSKETLQKLISCSKYETILVHFLDEQMWEVISQFINETPVLVWIHGAEVQPWYRRDYNYRNEDERNGAKKKSDLRMVFWRKILSPIPNNLKLVFVSEYFAEEVMEDIGFRVPKDHYTVIHNPIDTELCSYKEKSTEQRKKILSIRPYASAKYANDLSVKAVLELKDKPYFNELEFHFIGDGILFDETLEPLRKFSNIKIDRGFLTQPEIASLHKQYGIFLCPTRMDAQGVSRDEAMSSGLVPITNAVAAIPEFVDDSCGILAPGEDFIQMAEGIEKFFYDPSLFSKMSKNASHRVFKQSDKDMLIAKESKLIRMNRK
jgi:glycosyltransferase involved in cell wall biosynthesis